MAASKSQGLALTWGTTAVSEITNVSGPGFSHPTIDVSNLASTARAKIAAGIVDCGQVTLDLNFNPGTATIHDQLVDDVIAGTSRSLVITFPAVGTASTTTYTCNAYPTEVSPTASLGDKLSASATFDVDGVVTIAP